MIILATPSPLVRPRLAPPPYATWQEAMKDAVRDAGELCQLLGLGSAAAEGLAKRSPRKTGDNLSTPHTGSAETGFPVFVPRGYLTRMRPGDPADPLLRQVLPLAAELDDVAGFVRDPVGDKAATRQPGLLHKYAGRALLVATGTCAIHCRYCFRRHYPYGESPHSLADWQPALDEIAGDESLREVILSGGDPLTLVDSRLADLVARLDAICHLRRLRVHTRLPIVIPERVTDGLLSLLRGTRLVPIVVVHANHANELDAPVAGGLARMVDAGIVVLNQAVLLAGVNDTVDAQAELWERLVELRVMPYYLHQLDRVAGAAHFEVPVETGRQIIESLRARLPGYAVPRYVAEMAGAANKTVLA